MIRSRPTHGIFFQAPFGVMDLANGQYATLPTDRNILGSALNTWGYYVEAGLDRTVPGFVSQVVQFEWATRRSCLAGVPG